MVQMGLMGAFLLVLLGFCKRHAMTGSESSEKVDFRSAIGKKSQASMCSFTTKFSYAHERVRTKETELYIQ